MNDLDRLPLLNSIPEPTTVRARLARLVRAQSLPRALLRLSQRTQEAAERERLQQTEVTRGQ